MTSATQTTAADELVDWELAARTAARLAPSGPQMSRADARAVVTQLRGLAAEATGHVAQFTDLHATGLEPPHAVVVDRPTWAKANVSGFRIVLAPLAERLAERRAQHVAGGVMTAVGSRVTGAQIGAVLAYLSGKVLGQYEVFLPPGPDGAPAQGRLSLVAPNIVAAERALEVDPRDFRMWVCLHEAAHQAQFTAVPWLRGHIESEVGAFLAASDLDASAVFERLRAVAGVIGRRSREAPEDISLIEAVQTPEQREVFDRLTAVMTLLEGHGEFVMNGVGGDVVRGVEEIHEKFQRRRQGSGRADRLVRKLFGLDLKARQYAEGAAFVRAVVDRVGMTGFNRIWTSPQTLPNRSEIADPPAWMARVIEIPTSD